MRPGLLLVPALLAMACAESGGLRGGATSGPRTAANDDDLWNLVPAAADAIADVDMAALRASPWSQALMQGDLGGEREARARQFGFDVFTDADRMLVVAIDSSSSTAGPRTLTIARGRFDARAIVAAFSASNVGAIAAEWRGSQVIQAQARAVALVTARTLAQGDPDAVRAAIDAAWGMVPDARGGRLGELRRALDGERGAPAAAITLSVTDGMRARASDALSMPAGLRQVAARLDLGNDLDLDAVAVFDNDRDAAFAASSLREAARTMARHQMVTLLGLRAVFDGLSLTPAGTRVRARLHIPGEQREGLAEKLAGLLRLIAGSRR
jgi:hypothetical protein